MYRLLRDLFPTSLPNPDYQCHMLPSSKSIFRKKLLSNGSLSQLPTLTALGKLDQIAPMYNACMYRLACEDRQQGLDMFRWSVDRVYLFFAKLFFSSQHLLEKSSMDASIVCKSETEGLAKTLAYRHKESTSAWYSGNLRCTMLCFALPSLYN